MKALIEIGAELFVFIILCLIVGVLSKLFGFSFSDTIWLLL